jgi:ABC-type Mn2+/Zn2+ transport system permease subunit
VEWFLTPFELGFQQRALLGGVLAAIMASTVGTWLVLRGMSFFGDAFVHGVIPGIALAVVLDWSPLIGAAIAAGVMVAAIEWVQRSNPAGRRHLDWFAVCWHVGPWGGDHLADGLLPGLSHQHSFR